MKNKTPDPTTEPAGAELTEWTAPADMSLAAADPFNHEAWVVKDVTTSLGSTRVLTTCPFGKPSPTQFVRVRPNEAATVYLLQDKVNGDDYLVSPAVAGQFPGLVKAVEVAVAVDRLGNPLLWAIPIKPLSGKDNSWWQSGRAAKELALTQWVRIEAADKAYAVFTASATGIVEPQFPELSLFELLKLAFTEDQRIGDTNHPYIRQLIGQW